MDSVLRRPAGADGSVTVQFAEFVRALAVLSLPVPQQVVRLRTLFVPGEPVRVSELARELDDGYRMLPSFVRNGWVPEPALVALRDLDGWLGRMGGAHGAETWGVEQLEHTAVWAEARVLAGRALALL